MQHNISPPSRVKRIKEKERKEHRLLDFQYPNLPGQKKEHDRGPKQPHTVNIVKYVGKHPLAKHQKKLLTLTNKFKV